MVYITNKWYMIPNSRQFMIRVLKPPSAGDAQIQIVLPSAGAVDLRLQAVAKPALNSSPATDQGTDLISDCF